MSVRKFSIVGLIVFSLCFWYYHNLKVNSLEKEIENLVYERDDLKNKIVSIEKGLMDLGKNSPNKNSKPKHKKNVNEKTKNIVEKQTPYVNNEVKHRPTNNNDISLVFPNRTGQDLVNSLKLKTEL